jgi:hypothetical protein
VTVHIEDIMLFAIAQSGDEYVYGTEVNPLYPDSDKWDCSELWQIAGLQAGMKSFPDGSRYQWDWVKKAGRQLSVHQAMHTRGALLFIKESNGIVGHVVGAIGDGVHTIEAKGKKYGVGIFNSSESRFDFAGLIPGVDYSPRKLLKPPYPKNFVSELTIPDGSGGWYQTLDGGIVTWGVAPFWGSYPGLAPSKRQGTRTFPNALRTRVGKKGYILTSNRGETYTFGPDIPYP